MNRPAIWLSAALLAVPAAAADPEKPAEFTKDELATLWRGGTDSKDRDAIFQKYDGKLLKLTGEASPDRESLELSLVPRPKGAEGHLLVRLKVADHPTGKTTADRVRKATREAPATVYGRAAFSRRVERPTKDYKVPAELRPKGPAPGATESLQETYDRLQRGAIEGDGLAEKILADARKKGQVETVTVYGLFELADVVGDPKHLPAK